MTVEAPTTLKGKLAWIGVMLLVAVWMFVLGIMVGRATAPFDRINASIQEKLAELKVGPEGQGQETPSGPGKSDPDISMTDLNFYEKLKETEPAPPPKIPAVKPIKPVAPDPPKEKKPASPQPAEAPAPKNESPKIAESTPPPKSEAPPPSPSAPAPERASTSEHFTVQVAAVKNAEGAAKLIDQLREKGFDAYQISSQAQNGETWYRIRVGAFNTRTEAQSTAGRLSKMNFNGMVLATP